MRKPVILVIIAVIAAMLAASTCGGKDTVGSGGQPDRLVNPPTADSALAELDALACPEGVDAELWAELKGALEDALECRAATCGPPLTQTAEGQDGGARVPALQKTASTPPTGEANRVNDLAIADNGDGTFTLSWHYRNLGDYDQNGKVAIADITPLAQHFCETYDPETEPNSIQAVIDGSGNGKIGIEDVTPIAVGFGSECAGYSVRNSLAYPEDIEDTSAFDTAPVEPEQLEERRTLSRDITQSPHIYITVVPVDAEGTPGELSNAVYTPNHEPVAVLTADPMEGEAPLMVDFDASGSHDLDGPIAKYEWDWEGDGVWDEDTGETSTAEHIYDLGEVYEPQVRVTDQHNGRSTASVTVTVGAWHIVTVFEHGDPEARNTSLEIVNGHPAICLYCDAYGSELDGFVYVRANNPNGESWGTPLLLQSASVPSHRSASNSLIIANGCPAIAYADYENDSLCYVRASDPNGSVWGTPLKVDDMSPPPLYNSVSMVIVNEYPAIAYIAKLPEPAGRIQYIRANDPDGDTWGVPVRLSTLESSSISMQIVNGKPAISYVTAEPGHDPRQMNYRRAFDIDGAYWENSIDPTGGSIHEYSSTALSVVSGKPAISYFTHSYSDLMYVRAKDSAGSTWTTPLAVDSEGSVGDYCSLAIIHGFPAVSYMDFTNYSLKYVRASDVNGNSWRIPTVLDTDTDEHRNWYSSLKTVNDHPAISYVSATELKFAIYY